jgi:MFS family permease
MNKKMIHFCLIVGLFWFSLYIYVPIVPTYAVELGSSLFFVGIITGSYGLMQMLFRIPIGIASDKLGTRKLFIICGIAIEAIAGITMCISQTPVSLLVSRMFAGIAAAAWVSFSVHFSLYFKSEDGPKAMGVINAIVSIGQVLAVSLCGLVAGLTGKVVTFAIAAVIGCIALVLSLFINEPEMPKKDAIEQSEQYHINFKGNILLVSLLGLLNQYIAFATVYGFTPIIAKSLKANDFQESILMALFISPAIISSLLIGKLNNKFGGRKVLSICFIIFALDCLLTPFAGGITELFVITIIGGFAQGIIFSMLMGYIIKLVSPEKRNTAMGFYQAVFGLGMFLGPLVVGAFSNYISITWGFVFTSLIGFTAAGLSLKVPK